MVFIISSTGIGTGTEPDSVLLSMARTHLGCAGLAM